MLPRALARRYRLFSLLGIPVEVELTFLLLLGVYLLLGGANLLATALFIAAVIPSLLVHEFGHALAARRLGARGVFVRLHGAGGLTFHSPLGRAIDALKVSFAGPLAGLGLGALVAPAVLFLPSTGSAALDLFLEDLFVVNVFWSLFNLLPMEPLDGGHILRHSLKHKAPTLNRLTLEELLQSTTFFTAVAAGIAGMFLGQIFIILIAFFCAEGSIRIMRGLSPLKRYPGNLKSTWRALFPKRKPPRGGGRRDVDLEVLLGGRSGRSTKRDYGPN